MLGVLDPITAAALVIGLMTAVGSLTALALIEGPNRRRFARRLQAVTSDKPVALPAQPAWLATSGMARARNRVTRPR